MKQNKTWKVYIHTTPSGDVYVGVTGRKYLSQRWKPSGYKGTALEPYINEYGWENIKHEVIYTCEDREEALKKEDEMYWYYTEKGCCINRRRSGLVEVKDKAAYNRKRYQDNPEIREKNKELCRQYYQEHKEEKVAYSRKWRQDHKKEQDEYQRKYRAKKKAEKLKQSGMIEMPLAS